MNFRGRHVENAWDTWARAMPRVRMRQPAALPLLDVDWELVSDQDFRDLLAALNFEASYEPTKRELTIRVTLVPELTDPDGSRASLLSVLLSGHHSNNFDLLK